MFSKISVKSTVFKLQKNPANQNFNTNIFLAKPALLVVLVTFCMSDLQKHFQKFPKLTGNFPKVPVRFLGNSPKVFGLFKKLTYVTYGGRNVPSPRNCHASCRDQRLERVAHCLRYLLYQGIDQPIYQMAALLPLVQKDRRQPSWE